jgi:hypothetical protein
MALLRVRGKPVGVVTACFRRRSVVMHCVFWPPRACGELVKTASKQGFAPSRRNGASKWNVPLSPIP